MRCAVACGKALSSLNFSTKETDVVIFTTVEKVGNSTKGVVSIYVNPDFSQVFISAVENSCGKNCGECGKLLLFNRYSACFHFSTAVEKWLRRFS